MCIFLIGLKLTTNSMQGKKKIKGDICKKLLEKEIVPVSGKRSEASPLFLSSATCGYEAWNYCNNCDSKGKPTSWWSWHCQRQKRSRKKLSLRQCNWAAGLNHSWNPAYFWTTNTSSYLWKQSELGTLLQHKESYFVLHVIYTNNKSILING